MKVIIFALLAIIALASASSMKLCSSTGDPHYTLFNRRRFDNYWRGTFLMAKTSYFEVHSQTATWNKRYSVNYATGIRVCGAKFIVKDPRSSCVYVNGRRTGLRNGRQVIRGVTIVKSGSKLYFQYKREWVSVQTFYNRRWARYGSTQFQNVAVFGRAKRVGICGAKHVCTARGIFTHVQKKVKIIARSHCTRKHHRIAAAHCRRRLRRSSGRWYQWCVFDTCQGIKARWIASFRKQLVYWRSVMRTYIKYRKSHLRLARIYYKRSLKHLERMRFHRSKHLHHSRTARYWRNHGKKSYRKYVYHIRVSRKHKRLSTRSLKKYRLYVRYYRIYRTHSKTWHSRMRSTSIQIRRLLAKLRSKRRYYRTASSKFHYYRKLTVRSLHVARVHHRCYVSHYRSSVIHARKAAYYYKYSKKYHKKANWHTKMSRKHLHLHLHHKKHYHANWRLKVQRMNHAKYWLSKIRGTQRKVMHLTKLYQQQFRKEVQVLKTITVKSRTCRTVPKYLDNIKFCSSASARRRALRRCNHRQRFVKYSCVYDHAQGIFHTKSEYDLLAREERVNHKIQTCYSWGDPHNKNFNGRKYNVYNTRGWRNVFTKGNIVVKGYLSYTPTWGRRSINRWLLIKVGGRYTTFKPWGKTSGLSGWRCVKNTRRYREWVRYSHGYHFKVMWKKSRSGGYYNVYITCKHVNTRGCSGMCCAGRRGRSSKVTRRDGNPWAVRFKSKCQRKTIAYRVCAYIYRNHRGNKVHAIRNCVHNRRHL